VFGASETAVLKKARKAEKSAAQQAREAQKRASLEYANKRECSMLEQSEPHKQVEVSELTTTKCKKINNQKLYICAGSYVKVETNLSLNMCSHGGTGFVTTVVRADGNHDYFMQTFAVKYDKSGPMGGTTESGILYGRAHELPSPYGMFRPTCERRSLDGFAEEYPPAPTSTEPELDGISNMTAT
jgi:hypothetical protein